MPLSRALFVFLLLVAGSARGGALTRQAAPPTWFVEHLTREMQHGGNFLADNGEYRSANEPLDAFGLEWRWGAGRRSLCGRLFGLVDGQEVGDYWDMRLFWHPGRGEAWLSQFGADGTVGEGWVRPLEGGGLEMEQDFFAPDGRTYRVRHETQLLADGGHVGHSFDPAKSADKEAGDWTPRRSYVWEAVAPQGDGPGESDESRAGR